MDQTRDGHGGDNTQAPFDGRLYSGLGEPTDVAIPDAPPWRRFRGPVPADAGVAETDSEATIDPVAAERARTFVATEEVCRAVDAALVLRRPLLLTGRPGSGKSSLIESVARELQLGPVLHWHVTSRSTREDALYGYDAIGRLQAKGISEDEAAPPIEDYLRLGPLGTALLPSSRPRALLVDEIDKSDVDLPNDLLDLFERGEYIIPELARHEQDVVYVRPADDGPHHPIRRGRVACAEFPFVVLTSNGERDFPAPFLRRCIRLRMPDPDAAQLAQIITQHLGPAAAARSATMIEKFAKAVASSRDHATDQLMNAVFMVTRDPDAVDEGQDGGAAVHDREAMTAMLLKALSSRED